MARKNLIWAKQSDLSKDLSGKIYIVTGANSGVGLETTRQLIKQGGHVIMACRRADAAKEVSETFGDLPGSFEIMKLDLAEMQSVRNFVDEFLSKYKKLDGLMCNAGLVVIGNESQYTKDGFEKTFGINFLGHFLLVELLLDMLKKSTPSRIGLVSSVVHAGNSNNRPMIHFDDLDYKKRKYSAFGAYAEAKVADVLYMKELAERLKDTGVVTASIHPGWARSNFGGNGLLMTTVRLVLAPFMPFFSDSSYESAQASLHVLLSEDIKKHSGKYFSQSSVLYRDKECKNGGFPMQTPNPNADDMDIAKKLVEVSYKLVGLK